MAPHLTMMRCETVVSMSQLDSQPDDAPPKAPPVPLPGTLSDVLASDRPVSELRGAALVPTYCLPASEAYTVKRIRSFGDLTVPDTDNPAWCARPLPRAAAASRPRGCLPEAGGEQPRLGSREAGGPARQGLSALLRLAPFPPRPQVEPLV